MFCAVNVKTTLPEERSALLGRYSGDGRLGLLKLPLPEVVQFKDE